MSKRVADDLEILMGQVATEFFERLAEGERPSVAEYEQRYPEIADMIRHALPALQKVSDSMAGGISASRLPDEKYEKQLGDFRILRELGRGGMGIVYEAEQLSMGGRKVALKVLPFAAMTGTTRLQRFRNEVQAAASLEHPNIVSVYSVGEERGVHFYAMQLIRGQSLATLIHDLRELGKERPLDESVVSELASSPRAEGALPGTEPTEELRESQIPSHSSLRAETVVNAQGLVSTKDSESSVQFAHSVAELGIQIAEALDHAHQRGVVHRDIKPANLMIDANVQVHVTDFGLAQIEHNAAVTMTGDLVGTLRYMSPEQALGKRVAIDHRADIYSLGISLYELLTTEPAFASEDRVGLIKQIAFDEPKRLRQRDPSIPRDLETIIHKAIVKNPEERYATAQDLADDLKAFRDSRPIAARPPMLIDHIYKWGYRNQSWVLAGCIVLLMTSIGLAAGGALLWQSEVRARNNELTAIEQKQEAQKNLELANRNFEEARAAVDVYLTSISEEELFDNPGLQPLRQKLLRSALDYYQVFAQRYQSDNQLRKELGNAYFRMGSIEAMIGNIDNALELHNKALEVRLAEGTTQVENGLDLARSYRAIAGLENRRTNTAEANRNLELSFSSLPPLSEVSAQHQELQMEVIANNLLAGTLANDSGDRKTALRHAENAIEICNDLLKSAPQEAKFRAKLGEAHRIAFATYLSLRDHPRAEEHVLACMQISKSLVEEFPNVQIYKKDLSWAFNNLGWLKKRRGEYLSAVPLLEESISIARELASLNPEVTLYKRNLIGKLANMCNAYRDAKDYESAQNILEEQRLMIEEGLAAGVYKAFFCESLSMNHELKASIESDSGNFGEAIQHWRASASILDELSKTDGSENSVRYRRLQSRLELAHALDNNGASEAANSVREEVKELLSTIPQEEWKPVFFQFLAEAHYHTGNWHEVREANQHVLEAWGDDKPGLELGQLWWYESMTLYQLGEVAEANRIFHLLMEKLSVEPTPSNRTIRYRDQAAQVLGIDIANQVE